MPSLLELQRGFARGLLDPAGTLSLPLEPAVNWSIYQDTARTGMNRALELNYPAVRGLVGEAFFEAMASEFVARTAPTSACLDDYGEGLAAFVREFAPAASVPYLADVATLEWAVTRALHAEAAPAGTLERLAVLDETQLASVRFAPHPAVRLLALGAPADRIWRAVLEQDEAALAAIDPDEGPVRLLVYRTESVQVRRLEPQAWTVVEALLGGQPCGQAMDGNGGVGTHGQQQLLAELLRDGCLVLPASGSQQGQESR